jgi:hypothetical protein
VPEAVPDGVPDGVPAVCAIANGPRRILGVAGEASDGVLDQPGRRRGLTRVTETRRKCDRVTGPAVVDWLGEAVS